MNKNSKFLYTAIQISFLVLFACSSLYADECTGPLGYYICLENEFKEADRKLNISYKRIRNKLSKDQKLALRDAQRLWIKFRDSNCEMHFEFNEVENPQIGPELHRGGRAKIACLTEMTQTRTIELDDLYLLFE